MGRLENKIAIVTGGNSGIGRATALLFCKEGAKVVIACRREADNKKVVDEITARGGEVSAVQADVSKKEDCKRIINETINKCSRIDVLVNNAGIADKHMPINLCTEEWYNEVCLIDQYSVYYMSKYALEHMDKEYFETNVRPHMFYMSFQDIWRWKMNVARVMGNSRDEKYIPDLVCAFKENPDERVRGMAVWALGNIGGKQAQKVLEGLNDETSDLVREELRLAKES